MADQYQYAGMGQPGQAQGYPSFPPQYPNGSGDQGAQFLQGYALAQSNAVGNPAAMFGSQPFDQNPYTQNAGGMSVQQFGQQMNAAGLGAGFPYGDYSQFNQYGPGGGMPAQVSDMQQFGQLLPNSFNQQNAGNIYEAFAQDQGLAGFNAAAFLQNPSAGIGRGLGGFSGKGFGMNQRAGMNKFGNGNNNWSNNTSGVTNPDGLRDDTVFVSKLPQNIDHEIMKLQFGTIGKIKTNAKSGMPMIWIFKERGIPKGEALVTYEDPHCVQKAIAWFAENEFLGKNIDVKQAKNSQRPLILPSGSLPQQQGMNNMNAGNNQAAAFAAAAVAAAASGNTMSSLMQNSPAAAASMGPLAGSNPDGRLDMYGGSSAGTGQFGPRGDGPMRGSIGRPHMAGGGMNGPPMRGRAGDWPCPQCSNLNFGWREQCKQCGAPRVDDGMVMMSTGGPTQRGGMPANGGAVGGGMMGIPQHRGNGMPIMSQGGRGMGGPHPMAGGIPPPTGGGRGMMRGGGRGGGPMRGNAVSAGRMRSTPY